MKIAQIMTLIMSLFALGYLQGANNQLQKQEKNNQKKRAHQHRRENQ